MATAAPVAFRSAARPIRQASEPKKLTITELEAKIDNAFQTHERTVRHSHKDFLRIAGETLAEIHKDDRWKEATYTDDEGNEKEYTSFEDYSVRRFGYTRQRAHQLMDAVPILAAIAQAPDLGNVLVVEGHTREMTHLIKAFGPETVQQVVRETAAENNGELTAPTIKATMERLGVAKQVKPRKPKPAVAAAPERAALEAAAAEQQPEQDPKIVQGEVVAAPSDATEPVTEQAPAAETAPAEEQPADAPPAPPVSHQAPPVVTAERPHIPAPAAAPAAEEEQDQEELETGAVEERVAEAVAFLLEVLADRSVFNHQVMSAAAEKAPSDMAALMRKGAGKLRGLAAFFDEYTDVEQDVAP